MGSTLGAIFGGGESSKQNTTVDPTTKAMNDLRYQQLAQLFGNFNMNEFAAPGNAAFQPSQGVDDIFNTLMTGSKTNPGAMDFSDYYGGVSRISGMGSGNIDTAKGNYQDTLTGLNQNYQDVTSGVGANYNEAQANRQAAYDAAKGDIGYAHNVGINNLDSAYGKRYGDIMDTTGNYISDVATPQIMQNAVLQGLEGGGIVPTSIARATGEYGGPLLNSLIQQYMGSLNNLDTSYSSELANLGGQNLQTGAGLSNTLLNLESSLGQSREGALASLGQSHEGTLAGLGTNTQNLTSGYLQSMPQAAAIRAGIGTSLLPLADYRRGLAESELKNRQGVLQTAFTGIPYTPETSVKQKTSTQPLFNFFGQG